MTDKRRGKKIALLAGVVVVGGALVVTALKWGGGRQDDSDLILVPREVAKEDNGYWLLVDLPGIEEDDDYGNHGVIREVLKTERLRPGSDEWSAAVTQLESDLCDYSWRVGVLARAPRRAISEDDMEDLPRDETRSRRILAYAEALLRRSSAAFQRLDEALAKPDLVIPLDVSGDEYTKWYALASRVLFSATRQFNGGDVDAAIADCRRIITLGRRFARCPHEYSLGVNIEGEGTEHLLRIACVAELPPEQLSSIARELVPPDDRIHATADYVRANYMSLLSHVEYWEQNRQSGPLIVRLIHSPDTVLERHAEAYRALLEVLDQPGGPAPAAWAREPGRLAGFLDPMGQFLMEGIGDACEWIRDELWQSVLTARLRIGILAVKAHLVETGKLPARLDDLVPKYLDAVPTDPWDDKPLRYSTKARAIYASRGGEPSPRPDPDSEDAEESGSLFLWIDDYIPNGPR